MNRFSKIIPMVSNNFDTRNIVLLGDSVTLANAENPTDKGYFNWLNVMLSQRFDVVKNAGVGGDSTTQMLARLNDDVISYKPGWVFVAAGLNDVAIGTASATIISNILEIITRIHHIGSNVILSTLIPSSSFDSEEKGDIFRAVNVWIKSMASTWCLVVDPSEEYIDTTAPTLAIPLAGYTVDGVHPNALGASTIAAKMYADIKDNAKIVSTTYSGLAVESSNVGRVYYANANQLMAGTDGGKLDPATGVVASGFLASSGGTWSKVARTDSKPGTWQQSAIGAEGDAGTFQTYDITENFAVGETIFSQVEFESDDDWTSPEACQLYLACLDSGSNVLSYVTSLGHSTGGGSGTVCTRIASGILKTVNMVIPENTTKIRHYFQVLLASGTFRICRYEIKKV